MGLHRRIALTLTAATLIPFLAAGADRRQSYAELAAASDKVVLGTVAVKSSHWGDDAHIYTDVLISPDVTIKGEEDGPVVVRAPGGTVGDTTMTVSDGPEFPEGRRVVVFLKREGDRFVVPGRSRGSVDAESAEAAEAIDSAFQAAEGESGVRLAYKRGLAGPYLGRIGTAGGRAISRAGTQVGCYGTDGGKWATSSATYKIGDTIPEGWAASIDASAATWNAAGAGFQLVNDSASVNELSYKDLVASYGSSYSNTFAVTTTWSRASTGRITKATIEVGTKWPWSTSGEARMADVQNILTHEFGHWMRLLDIYSPSACADVTMWGSASYGETKKRTLEQADIDGFLSLYSGASTTVAAPVLTSPANGATGVAATPTLSWNAASNATSYDVYFGATPTPALVATVSATSYQPGSLSAGATYYWRVAAKNSTGSASSSTFSFTVAAGTPGATSGPALLSPADGSTDVSLHVVMQWTAVPGATAYDLYVGTTASPPRIGTVGGTMVTVYGFQPGTLYYWKVVARTPTGSLSSAVASFQTK